MLSPQPQQQRRIRFNLGRLLAKMQQYEKEQDETEKDQNYAGYQAYEELNHTYSESNTMAIHHLCAQSRVLQNGARIATSIGEKPAI